MGFKMVYIPQIQSTTDYNSFKLFIENRPISRKHVNSFIDDKTFPDKFPTAAIVVDKEMRIIDGQHRYSAAKELGIPVYYVVDPTATIDDIRLRNKKNKEWNSLHYIHYFSHDKDDYKTVLELKEKHEVTLTFLKAAILRLCHYGICEMSYIMKDGELNLKGKGKELTEFCDSLVPVLKKHRLCYTSTDSYPLFSQAYTVAFMAFFIDEKNVFKRILGKLSKSDYEPPITHKFEKARDVLRKIAYRNRKLMKT